MSRINIAKKIINLGFEDFEVSFSNGVSSGIFKIKLKKAVIIPENIEKISIGPKREKVSFPKYREEIPI